MAHFHMVSPNNLKQIIAQKFDEHKTTLTTLLSLAEYVCCTADIWSTKRKSFMGVTVHWIDKDTLERQSKLLCCRRFYSPHDNVRIAELLSDIYTEFGITFKVIGTVIDNASNFTKAFKTFGISIDEFETLHKSVDEFNDILSSIPDALCDGEQGEI